MVVFFWYSLIVDTPLHLLHRCQPISAQAKIQGFLLSAISHLLWHPALTALIIKSYSDP
jgi:hypothetical protein